MVGNICSVSELLNLNPWSSNTFFFNRQALRGCLIQTLSFAGPIIIFLMNLLRAVSNKEILELSIVSCVEVGKRGPASFL